MVAALEDKLGEAEKLKVPKEQLLEAYNAIDSLKSEIEKVCRNSGVRSMQSVCFNYYNFKLSLPDIRLFFDACSHYVALV